MRRERRPLNTIPRYAPEHIDHLPLQDGLGYISDKRSYFWGYKFGF